MRGPAPRFRDALEVLARHRVEYIVVGGVAAVLRGAPISTFDLDIVHQRDTDNVARLIAALTELDACYRDPAGRVLRPEASGLEGPGHHLLMTRYGPLDVLGEIGAGNDHAGLLEHSDVFRLGALAVRVLGLPALIRAKTEAGRPKDLAVLGILRRTLAESTGMRDAPHTFGPEFLEWLRHVTEQAWALVEQPSLETFEKQRVGGAAWQRGTRWGPGLSDAEIDSAERTWGLVFPPDHRLFLRTLHAPDRRMFSAGFVDGDHLTAGTAPSFFDWRSDRIEIAQAMAWPLEGIAFDVEQADLWLPGWGERPGTATARLARLRELVGRAPRLIPVCGHRFLLGDPPVAGNPVLSVYQADIIVYGYDLRQFLLNELAPFLGVMPDHSARVDLASIPFWGELV